MATPGMEDYLEQIYLHIERNGVARASDIADSLDVLPSSVTKMVQRLDREGYVYYERYKGIELTEKGLAFGRKLVKRHDILEEFLRIIGVKEEKIYDDVEGIEHHLSWNAIDRIADLVETLEQNPEFKEKLKAERKK
ncbi:transcriptional regulator MntR [Sporosarcina pasteurii]|uniref:Manganese transport regulator n=1 Tax=Sporosarcina pasteurii TaxID=1474 RepID=A0A380CGJ1_SPOPA|nr:transcriptional regulator MntR [Sporosarcina pasteurii]MDS9472150.1 transcriptional regulator MntR [Sporosarcina pasteurii]QBQ06863.1 transcriptional regulator MntR [Sporosarcina pasteurii]SUJ20355.1 Manganese transport regulator [Sporosarcina pasteurii]